jgi:dienelactone hydrolase
VKLFFDDESFSYELLRTVGYSAYGGADIAECLGVAERITCPTLVCEAEDDQFFRGQPELLFKSLTCPKTYARFTAAEGAEEHCHVGATRLLNQRVFDWLSSTMSITETTSATTDATARDDAHRFAGLCNN